MTPKVIVLGSRVHRVWQVSGVVLVVFVVVLLPVVLEDYQLTRFAQVVPYAVALLGLNLVSGLTGQVSLGHAAFFGVGAYTTAILFTDHGWPFLATLPVAAVLGLLLGFAVGVPALRLRGLYLAISTLAVGVTFPVLVTQPFAQDLGTGGVAGKTAFVNWQKPAWFGLNVTDLGWKFVVMAVIAAVLFWLATGLVRSRVGRSLVALRENETAAAVAGVWPAAVKTGAFAISALYGALGGSLYVLVTPIVSPAGVGFTITLLFITAMALGGSTTISGAWIGGLIMVFLPFYSAQWAADLPGLSTISEQPGLFSNVIYGVILIVTVFLLPRGIAPLFTKIRARFADLVPAEVGAARWETSEDEDAQSDMPGGREPAGREPDRVR